MSRNNSLFSRTWQLFCSLKLAIVLASLITLLAIYGSLVIHGHPALFGNLDQLSLRSWARQLPTGTLIMTWWLSAAGLLLILFSLNTLCCFIDWALHVRARWRKSGEYLIHLGVILLAVAFAWGSWAGVRSDRQRVYLHEKVPVPGMPGHELIVDAVEPVMNQQGRPLDMLNQVRLVKGDQLLAAEQVRINHPLSYQDLVVVPVSFGQEAQGYECFMPGLGQLQLIRGARIELDNGKILRVQGFYADATRIANGEVVQQSSQLQNPALLLDLSGPGIPAWRGWYFLREQLPFQLVANGIRFWPVTPIFNTYTVLTINYDPGADLALAGGSLLLIGTLLTLASFYRKRRANDRPEV
ncbi:MAG TPA: hypothetical protein VJ995_08410 [Geothermobacteraceae bacterium]|nr:hypothetical protein [Geothermobacteraceae bacterium]